MSLKGLAPDLKGVMRDLDPLVDVSRRGLPALETILDDTSPLLATARALLPARSPADFDYLGLYKREITAFFANGAAATQAPTRRHRAAAAEATCAPPTRSTRRCWPPTTSASPPTARTPTPSRAPTDQLARGPAAVRQLPLPVRRGDPQVPSSPTDANLDPPAAGPDPAVRVHADRARRAAVPRAGAARPPGRPARQVPADRDAALAGQLTCRIAGRTREAP